MTKSFALVLALIMVFGCLFSVAPMADEGSATPPAETPAEKYVPEIAYSNVNYTAGLTLMFAVPAPASLDEGASVKVVVWEEPSALYSYNEAVTTDAAAAIALAIEAESAKATIGGKEYLVFKYEGFTADMMTDVIYARPVVVSAAGKATAYGDVIDYSIVEYVKSAKGEIEGTTALGNADVLALLDSMVSFGSVAQVYLRGDEVYTPNGFFADDDVNEIWITPVVAGQTCAKVLGGFFKYTEGGFATVYAPFYDGLKITAYKDAAGAVIEDANQSSALSAIGFQVPAVDGDVNITIEYSVVPIRNITADVFGLGFSANNTGTDSLAGDPDIIADYKVKFASATSFLFGDGKCNFSGAASVLDTNGRYNYFNGIKTVPNPSNPDDLVFMITSTNTPTLEFSATKANTDFNGFGYGDTVEDALTIEFEIGRPNPEAVVTTGGFYFRTREANRDADAWAYANGGKEYKAAAQDHYLFRITNNVVHFQVDSKTRGADIATIPETGMIKVAITVFSSGEMHGYVADQNGNMQLVATDTMVENARCTKLRVAYEKAVAEGNTAFAEKLAPYANFGNWFAMNALEPTWITGPGIHGVVSNKVFQDDADFIKTGTVVINGVETPLLNADGTYNIQAIQLYAEAHYSFLLDNFRFFGGAVYN